MISIEKVDIMYNNYTHFFSMIDNHMVNFCLNCYKVGVMIQSSHNLNLWNHITLVKGLEQCNSTLCPSLVHPSCFIWKLFLFFDVVEEWLYQLYNFICHKFKVYILIWLIRNGEVWFSIQKEYLKTLKEKKAGEYIFGDRKGKNEGIADVVESYRQTALQWENTKRLRQKKSYKEW